jgi:DNA-binding IclR family transcriptional regulator
MTASYSVPPVERAFKLLRRIASGDNAANVSETARALKLSRTTIIRLLATLEAEQMIEKLRDGAGYKLGLGLAGLAGQALVSSDIVQAGDPVLRTLAETLGLSAHIGVLSGRDVLYLARRAPNVSLVSNVGIGSRLPAHATTLGRIILAFTPREAVADLFKGARLTAATTKTPTTLAALMAQIDADRAAGMAWSDQHFEVGISSAAAPVFDRTGQVIGAINVTGPSASFTTARRREIENVVRSSAERVSRSLGFVLAERSTDVRSTR